MVQKGREYKKRDTGFKYLNKDNAMLKIIMYLYFVGKSNKNKILTDPNAKSKNLEHGRLNNLLEKLIANGLVEKYQSEDASNVIMYTLLEPGKKIAKFVEENSQGDKPHPIFKLDVFSDVKYLGQVNS